MQSFSPHQLRECRAAVGLSRVQLAAAAGLGYMTVGYLERGQHRPTADTVAALADALGVSPGELFADDAEQAA